MAFPRFRPRASTDGLGNSFHPFQAVAHRLARPVQVRAKSKALPVRLRGRRGLRTS